MFNKRRGIETRTTAIIDRLKMFGKSLSDIMGFVKKNAINIKMGDVITLLPIQRYINPELLRQRNLSD
jgi:hypothetical protein